MAATAPSAQRHFARSFGGGSRFGGMDVLEVGILAGRRVVHRFDDLADQASRKPDALNIRRPGACRTGACQTERG
jgi:hypothetical protein